MALEIVAGRALAPYVGMSLYTWTVIIAVVLAGLSIGHWIGGVMSDRCRSPGAWVCGTLLGSGLTAGISLVVLRWIAPVIAGSDPVSHVTVLAMTAFFLPSLGAGVVSPLLTKMALDATPPARHGRIVGRMFALGAAGAICGTLLAGLLLISWVGTIGSVVLITAVYLLLALGFARSFRSRLGVLVLIAGSGAGAWVPGGPLEASPCTTESSYFCIRIDPVQAMGREAGVMALDHLAHGMNDRADPLLLLSPYVHGVDELIRLRMSGRAPETFFIGGGAFTLPRAWTTRWPNAPMVVAELDPRVTRLARERLWLGDPPNLAILHADGRTALRTLPPDQLFDVVFGDAFHDISVPQHLVTDEFHAEIAARLRRGGAYAINVVDVLREPRFMLSLVRTLAQRFAHVEIWLDVEAILPQEARTTWIVLASDRATPAVELRASYGFDRTWVQVPVEQMVTFVGEGSLVTLTDDYAPVDRLLGDLLLDSALAE